MRELEKVETKEEADELDRKISALTAQLDEDDARYAPGAEQARTRKRLENIARETIDQRRRRGRSPFGSSTDPSTPRDI